MLFVSFNRDVVGKYLLVYVIVWSFIIAYYWDLCEPLEYNTLNIIKSYTFAKALIYTVLLH
jgi:hypothetical protein